MPYYITKESIDNEILKFFNLSSDISVSSLQHSLNNFVLDVVDDNDFLNEVKNSTMNRGVVENFSDMLFQLKDYRFYLKVILTILLKCKKYSEIAYLINRTFVNHIGDVFYVSGKNYDYSERYFDRFVEAVKYTEIENELILDFVFYVNQTTSNEICNRYLRPSKEYLKGYILENEKEYFEYIEKTEETYLLGIKLYIEQYTEKGLNLILEKYVTFEAPYENVIEGVIKEYKHNALPIIEKLMNGQNVEHKLKALNLLKLFKNDIQINNFVENFYKKLDDETVKQEIKTNFLSNVNIEFSNVEDYKKYVSNKKINVIDTNLPNIYPLFYKNGEKVDEVVLSYIFECFKNLDKAYKIKDLEYLKNLLDLNSALDVSKSLYENHIFTKIINGSSVWAVAFIIMFGDSYLNNEIISQVKAKMIDVVSFNKVLELYAEFNDEQVLKLVKDSYVGNHDVEMYNILKVYARLNKISVEDYIDSMVDTYKLSNEAKRDIYFNGNYLVLNVTDNLNVEVIDYASKSNYYISKDMVTNDENYFQYILNLKKEIKDQIQRFKDAFYNFRLWDVKEFENNILENPLLCKIASTLTWGYYKGTKLISVFRIVDNNIKIILNSLSNDEVYKIGLVHPVELDQNKEIVSNINFEPFNQLRRSVFKVNSNEFTLSRVSTFSGMLANYNYFIDYLRLQHWENGLEVLGNLKSLVKKYPNENLLCEITFDKIDTDTITIADIRFYNLSSTTSKGNYYIIDKNESLLINVIPKRTYSNVLFEISQACFN